MVPSKAPITPSHYPTQLALDPPRPPPPPFFLTPTSSLPWPEHTPEMVKAYLLSK